VGRVETKAICGEFAEDLDGISRRMLCVALGGNHRGVREGYLRRTPFSPLYFHSLENRRAM